jgi:hypothetical protein
MTIDAFSVVELFKNAHIGETPSEAWVLWLLPAE